VTERPLCSRCRSRKAARGKARCGVCLTAERAHDASRRESGWCVDCRVTKRVAGKTRCAECAKTRAAAAKALTAARRLARECVTCGAGAVDGSVYCAKHREYYRARSARR
jgi:hypothetical protein